MPAAVNVTDDHRSRLLTGMVDAIAELGYADIAIADVVRHARVSKRTFYEHFSSKEDCLLALYEAQSARVLAEIEAAIAGVAPGEGRVLVGAAVYLATLQSRPGLLRTLLVEILHVGPRGLQVRRQVMRQFVDLLLRELTAATPRTPVSPAVVTALVGGVNELILEAVEDGRGDRLGELLGHVTTVVRTFLR